MREGPLEGNQKARCCCSRIEARARSPKKKRGTSSSQNATVYIPRVQAVIFNSHTSVRIFKAKLSLKIRCLAAPQWGPADHGAPRVSQGRRLRLIMNATFLFRKAFCLTKLCSSVFTRAFEAAVLQRAIPSSSKWVTPSGQSETSPKFLENCCIFSRAAYLYVFQSPLKLQMLLGGVMRHEQPPSG